MTFPATVTWGLSLFRPLEGVGTVIDLLISFFH